jgi:signal transduction histidine kinase/CheY-like chemotaxis protein
LRYPVRSKIVLFILIPTLSAYALLFGLGASEMRRQSSLDAQRWLSEHAASHAYRMQLALTHLAESTRQLAYQIEKDLQEGQAQKFAVARLIDRLAVTGTAYSAGLQVHRGPGLFMLRDQGKPQLLQPSQFSRQPELARWGMPPDHSPGIRYQHPLRGDRELLGSVFLQMSPQQLHQILQQARGEHTIIYLLDAAGHFLLHPNPSLIGRTSPFLPDTSASLRLATWQGDARAHLSARTPITGTEWQVVVLAPEDALLAPMLQRIRWAMGLLLLSLGIIVGAVVLVSSRTLRPMADLAIAADEIARGNDRTSLPPQGNDEFGRIAQALRRLSSRQQRQVNEHAAEREQLQARMQARTRELGEQIDKNQRQQEELRMARDQAEQANRAKSEFLSNMSHELRTPLNGVLGYAQILRRDRELKPRQRENLEAIESCGQHLLTLINDVLDLSKIEAGRMQLVPAPLDLHKLCREVRDMLAQRAQAKGLDLHLELAPDVPGAIRSDATKLRQILLNLVGNAVKFTETGAVTLRVQRHGERLHFDVEDTGVGIPPDKIGEIFDAFRQAEAGVLAGGTGLGLAINQRLLELLGGTPISVSSEPHQGSCFSFELPFEEAAPGETEEHDDTQLRDDACLYLEAGQQVRLLAVDDRADNLEILRRLLGDAGFEVETCGDAASAIARLREQHFDLVLMDIRMPGMSGLEAAQLIRADQGLRDNKLVAVSASVFPAFREQVLEGGFDDFIAKPFRGAELFAVLQKHLGVRYRQEEVAPVEPHAALELSPEQAQQLAARIEQALEMGDMGALGDLGDKEAPPALREQIASLARQFDFDALGELARQLRE